jgi:hypothetical protein
MTNIHSVLIGLSILFLIGSSITLIYMLATRPKLNFHGLWGAASSGDKAARLYLILSCSAFASAFLAFVVARL